MGASSTTTDWSAGYVTEVGYTFGYYAELNPARLAWPLLRAGLAVPEVRQACELAFGQGLSLGLHAAAGAARWWGNDFNPAQAAFAQALAQAGGAGAQVGDESFAEMLARTDLPQFDFIGLHGIYSWVDAENRARIVEFVRRQLRPGGVLYISYNTAPGWAGMLPVRRLMAEHAAVMGAPGQGMTARIEGTLAFMQKLMDAQPLYAKANPQLAARLAQLKDHNRSYLAHEYFNREWRPVSFCDLAAELAPAKLGFAASAHALETVDALNLTPPQQALLQGLPDADFRQTVRDVITNQQFRRDYWVKGARRLSAHEQGQALRAQWLVLQTPRAEVTLKARGAHGEAVLSEQLYPPVLDALADHQPRTVQALEAMLAGRGVSFPQLLEVLTVLMGKGDVAPAQSPEATAQAVPTARRVNAWLMQQAEGSGELAYLASPVTGGGVLVHRFHQLFLQALLRGAAQPADWAQAVWALLQGQGQRLVHEGKTLETPEDNLAELRRQAERFAQQQLPVLRALQVV